jgi:hypothetical protein
VIVMMMGWWMFLSPVGGTSVRSSRQAPLQHGLQVPSLSHASLLHMRCLSGRKAGW